MNINKELEIHATISIDPCLTYARLSRARARAKYLRNLPQQVMTGAYSEPESEIRLLTTVCYQKTKDFTDYNSPIGERTCG